MPETAEWLPPIWSILPFVGMLLSIALLPVLTKYFWHSLRNQMLVALAFSLPVVLIYFQNKPHGLIVSLEHYLGFVILLAALFTISGGIWISGGPRGTPLFNTLFLALGAALSNFIGTTGASMVLIRPFLMANASRTKTSHLPIFFIVLVSNIGGLLTPLGDPPLFLGFLNGVPFFWTLKLFPIWLFTVALVLVIFYWVDRLAYQRESAVQPLNATKPFHLSGKRNFFFLTAVILSVFIPAPYREITMITAAILSYRLTPSHYHQGNGFSFYPIGEVAILFLGIFVTMTPALAILRVEGFNLGLTTPAQFFWSTGLFSSVLDNAPTYLTFAAIGQSLKLGGPHMNLPETLLEAISVGAVFFGAMTYIGNAPNFMVRSISEHFGVKVPTFFGYILRVAPILLPVFALVTLIFFR